MDAATGQIVKDLAHLVVDKELEILVNQLAKKLPPSLQGFEMALQAELLPLVIKFLDAKIDAL